MSSSPKSELTAIVDRLLRGQAYRELGAARLFDGARALAPNAALAAVIDGHAAEERAHYRAVIDVWAAFTGESSAALEARAEARLRERPLPAVTSWFALGMAQFLFDRAGLWQLREYTACSFQPYRALVAAILLDERAHQDFGAEAVIAGCRAGEPEADSTFACWLAVALRSFGRPGSDGDRAAVAAGLKRRPAAAVMRDFLDDIRPTAAQAGLIFPGASALGVALPADLLPALR